MQTKSILVGLVIGVILTAVIGFKLMGWKTRSASEAVTKTAMQQSAQCVAKFVKAPNYPARAKELGGKYAFEVAPYIEKGGWAKAEGAPAEYSVSEACASGVELLVGK